MDNENYHSIPATTYVQLGHIYFEEKSTQKTKKFSESPTKKFQKFRNIKEGSFQVFCEHNDIAGDYSPKMFPTKYFLLLLSQVHKIAILDIRILNCDRNEENLLVKRLIN